uniref:Uncharacterized protein n=1 Tax=Anguilla anguilla TaxID=7936 RepID=A0A0E9W2C6_ANGAN
MQVRPVNGCTF